MQDLITQVIVWVCLAAIALYLPVSLVLIFIASRRKNLGQNPVHGPRDGVQ